jgi:hypothetical protein
MLSNCSIGMQAISCNLHGFKVLRGPWKSKHARQLIFQGEQGPPGRLGDAFETMVTCQPSLHNRTTTKNE